jgi:hypothetical protein
MKQNAKHGFVLHALVPFIRNSSGKRLNTNSHEVKGNNARYIDYEIGRVQGKYFQNDPVS